MHYCAACHHPMLDNNFRHICQSVLEDRVRALQEQIRVLREALISVVIGNDIAAAHNAGKLTSWPGSVPAKEARAALAATEPGP